MMMLSDKVYVGLEHAPLAFDLCSRVLGQVGYMQGGANLDFIRSETGAMVILKGGSGDKMNPLHLALNHHRGERLAAARTLALSLVESVRQEFQQWSSQNVPAMPALNVPPPVMVNRPASVPVQVPSMPPPSVPAAPPPAMLNVTPMQPQVLQLVPQQQIFVAQDGTHYVKVTFAQTPTANVGPLTAMSLGPQQMQGAAMSVMAQQPPQGYAQAPVVETLSNVVPSPSVCSAPTLSTPSLSHRDHQWGQHTGGAQHSGGSGGIQPWASVSQQVAPVPAPTAVQVNTAAPPPMNVAATNAWGQSASSQQNANRPWGEPKQTTQQPTNQTNSLGGNIPWYKNLQNTASAPQQNKQNENRSPRAPRVIVDEWTESSDQNNSGAGNPPAWAPASVSAKAAMPDLLEEINSEKEGDDDINRPRRDYGRESRSGRRDHRRERRRERRPYTDADVYRRQFRSGGVLGEERNGGEENATQQEAENKQHTHMDQQAKDVSPQGQRSAQGPGMATQGGPPHNDRYLASHLGGQRPAQGQPQGNPPAPTSKWDRPAPNQPPPTNQYNQPNNYNQQQQHQYHNQQYQQQPNQYAQQPSQQKPPTSSSESQSANYDKQTPTTQYVGAPTQYSAPTNSNWSNYYYNNESKPTWNQSQHPWNRNTQAGQEGQEAEGQYGQRPWHNANSTLPPPPPAPPIDNPPSGYWSGY